MHVPPGKRCHSLPDEVEQKLLVMLDETFPKMKALIREKGWKRLFEHTEHSAENLRYSTRVVYIEPLPDEPYSRNRPGPMLRYKREPQISRDWFWFCESGLPGD